MKRELGQLFIALGGLEVRARVSVRVRVRVRVRVTLTLTLTLTSSPTPNLTKAPQHGGLGSFSLVQDPSLTTPPLKVQWAVTDMQAASRLHALLSSRPSKLSFEIAPPSASGRVAVP